MSLRHLSTLAIALLGCGTLFAGPREDEAKRYANDLKSKSASVRLTAVKELGKLGSLHKKFTLPYVSNLMSALEDADPKVRGEAARVIGLIDVEDKKAAVTKIAGLLKAEKSEAAREGQETGLGELGATTDDGEVKKMALDALAAARKKADSKREQKVIQAARILITGKKKKN